MNYIQLKLVSFSLCISVLAWINPIFSQDIRVEKNDSSWQLLVDGAPYEIKGATFGYDKNVAQYDSLFAELNFLGVNTIRTWATGDNTSALLDAAHKHNIKVMLGIWMRHGRPGMEDDDSFDYLEDEKGKEDQYLNAIKVVNTYKEHPAVLTWGIGNEVYLNTATDEEKMAYSELLERICHDIKEIDSIHLITSVEAWTFGLEWWQEYVPSLDIYGLNAYGFGASLLQDELDKRNIDKPYVITEFGVTGEWDIEREINGVKAEPSDAEKYKAITHGYENWIAPKRSNLGVFVFHYASSTQFLAPWLLTHYEAYKRPQYWAIRKAFTGKDPDNVVPDISSFSLVEDSVESGQWVKVDFEATDQENQKLEVLFKYNQRTGSRKRKDQILPLEHRGSFEEGFEVLMPKVDGPMKVYAMAIDGYCNMGIASTGIVVSDEVAGKREYLVPIVELPFYVYKDGTDDPYYASAYMGNYKAMNVNISSGDEVYSGSGALKLTYTLGYDWYGLALVDPANDWGEILGGYDISGAKSFSFWAKADTDNVKASVGFGLIEKDKPFPDTAKKSIDIELGKEWKKYTISTKKLDLSCIRSGFTIFASGYGIGYSIYIDEVVFE